MSDDLKRSGGFIPVLNQGVENCWFSWQSNVFDYFPGSYFLALIAIVSSDRCEDVHNLGQCSLEELSLIMVGVA
jgi:hypothetical protein